MPTTRIPLLLTAAAAFGVVLASAAPVRAQAFACGDTIGPGAKVALTADVATCTSATDAALTIVGPSKVDMAGFRVLCDPNDPPLAGILVDGKGVKLSGGGTVDCGGDDGVTFGAGIVLIGDGSHKLDDLVVESSALDGFRIESDKNKLRRAAANDNADDGVEINSSGNKLDQVAAIANQDDGFRIDGDGNKLGSVVASGNGSDGFVVESGGAGNKIKAALFADNGDDGVALVGPGNEIAKSVAVANGDLPEDAGIDLQGDGNRVKQTRSLDNHFSGVRADAGASGNTVQKNVALLNEVDLVDRSPGGTCDGNTWKKNVFGTSDADGNAGAPCIQ